MAGERLPVCWYDFQSEDGIAILNGKDRPALEPGDRVILVDLDKKTGAVAIVIDVEQSSVSTDRWFVHTDMGKS